VVVQTDFLVARAWDYLAIGDIFDSPNPLKKILFFSIKFGDAPSLGK
jgi:hypothetical protein